MHVISRYLYQLKLCAKTQNFALTARQHHARLIKTGLNERTPFSNIILNIYSRNGLLQDVHDLFDEMPQRDHVTWCSILTAYNQADLPTKTLSLLPSMWDSDGLQPDHFVYATLVKACASLCAVRLGRQVHARFVSSPFGNDDVVKSSLVDLYAKCGLPKFARAVFDSILVKNSVAWTAMLSGYSRSGLKVEALELFGMVPVKDLYSWTALISGLVQSGNGIDGCHLFIEMRREKVDIVDPLVLSSVVGASANLAVLGLGKQLHGLVIVLGYESSLFVSNALVDMYAKCSDIIAANNIFGGMPYRDVISWTSVIVGAAQHGRAKEALDLYDKMVLARVEPNEVTFIGLIYACSHAGLVSKGRELFKSLIEDYRIRPSLQHFTCLLDLLSRSGHLDEAENVINTMPFKPDEPMWAALLSACKQHGNIEMGIRVADQLLSSKPEYPSTFILLSNVYASSGMWENVSKVRRLLISMKVKQQPGCSCINLGKESQVFHAGEMHHPLSDEIYGLLKELDVKMRKIGYVPDTSFVLHDMEEQEKERQLLLHSERLAVAYGLLRSVPGTVIRIVKNLRVCGDCHTFLKLLSSIVQREVIVRDNTRYHHFKNGSCSCNDFW